MKYWFDIVTINTVNIQYMIFMVQGVSLEERKRVKLWLWGLSKNIKHEYFGSKWE
jgi:hypothetical protein